MGKLFKLKKWLAIEDAAKHLSIVFGEEVTKADILRFALDGYLKLSVQLVNGACSHPCLPIQIQDIQFEEVPGLFGEPVQLTKGGPIFSTEEGKNFQICEIVYELDATVWDLPMIGNERLDIEHEYQRLTGGPDVTRTCLDGAFVVGTSGNLHQLLEDYEKNVFKIGSRAHLEKVKQFLDNSDFGAAEAATMLNRPNEERKKFLEERKSLPEREKYYPAPGLPDDSVLVVRTEALAEFESSINGEPILTDRSHISNKLALLSQAAAKFWANADRDERSTHTDNATIVAWLIERGYSETLAEKAATIIRPDWAPTGRKPEK